MFGVVRGNQRRYARVRYGRFDEGARIMTDIDATQECSGPAAGENGPAGGGVRPGDDLLVLIFQAFATAFGAIPKSLRERFGVDGSGTPGEGGLSEDARGFGEITAGMVAVSLREDGTVDPDGLAAFAAAIFAGDDDLPPSAVLRGITRRLAAALNDGPMRPRLAELEDMFRDALARHAGLAAQGEPDGAAGQPGRARLIAGDAPDGEYRNPPLQTVVLGAEPYVLIRIVREEGSTGALQVVCGGGVAMDDSGRFSAQELLRKVAGGIDGGGAPIMFSRGATTADLDAAVEALVADFNAEMMRERGAGRREGEPEPEQDGGAR